MNRTKVERALSLLVQASRVSPPLREAVGVIEDAVRRLYERDEQLRDAILDIDAHSPDPVRGPVGSPSGSGSAGEASTSGSMPARGRGCQTCGFDFAAAGLPYCTVCAGAQRLSGVKWCVTHDRPARGFVAAVCPHEASCNVVDLPAPSGSLGHGW